LGNISQEANVMKKSIMTALALLVLINTLVSAQVGVGLTAGYPVGYAFAYYDEYGELPSPPPIFWGATVKWKPSALLVDSGVGICGIETVYLLYGYVDLGVAFDLWIFRFGLGGGFDMVSLHVPGYPGYSAIGPSARTSLDIKLGPVTVGASVAFPIDIIAAILGQEDLGSDYDILRYFAGHASLNVTYWYGGSPKVRTKVR
jgi:hypothetical protein